MEVHNVTSVMYFEPVNAVTREQLELLLAIT